MDINPYLNKKIQEAEDSILDVKQNHLKVEYFIIFAIIGAERSNNDPSRESLFINRKVKYLMEDPRACEVIDFPHFDLRTGKKYSADISVRIEEAIKKAAENHIKVKDLTTFNFCPVIIGSSQQGKHIRKILDGVKQYSEKTQKTVIWQPFIIIENALDRRENNKNSIVALHDFFQSESTCAKCCLLSDADDNDLAVEYSLNLALIVLAAILHTVGNPGAIECCTTFQQMLSSRNNKGWCYTAKNITISLPVRSLTLRKVSAIFRIFYSRHSVFAHGNTWGRLNLSLSDFLKSYYGKLINEKDFISTLPLYAAPVQNPEPFLDYIRKRYYEEQMNGAVDEEEIESKLYEHIMTAFFSNDGSLDEIVSMTDEIRKAFVEKQQIHGCLILKMPGIPANRLQEFKIHREYDEDLRAWLSTFQRKLLISVIMSKKFRVDLPKKAGNLSSRIESMLQEVENQAAKYEAAEIGAIYSYNNLEGNAGNIQGTSVDIIAANKKFDLKIMELLKGNGEGTEDESSLLDICFDCIKDRQESPAKYMKQVSDICGNDERRADGFIQRSVSRLAYPVRVFNLRKDNQTGTIIIGNGENSLFARMVERLKAKKLLIGDDTRIEIVRISEPFSHEDLTLFR